MSRFLVTFPGPGAVVARWLPCPAAQSALRTTLAERKTEVTEPAPPAGGTVRVCSKASVLGVCPAQAVPVLAHCRLCLTPLLPASVGEGAGAGLPPRAVCGEQA